MRRSRTIRIAAYGACGLLALIGLLIAALHTPQAKQFALRQAVRILHGQGIDFEASRLDYNLLSRRVDLWKLKVQSRQTPDLPPLVLADRLSVALNLRKLLAGAYYAEDATIENPQVQVVVAADGRDNIPKLPKSNSQKPVDYLVRHLRISGGAVRVEERRQQISASVPLESLTVEGDPATKNHRVGLRAKDGGQITLAGRSLPVRGLAGDFVIEKDAAQIAGLRMQFGESRVTISGKVSSFASPGFDLSAEANLALESVVAFAGAAQRLRGNVNVALTANGPLASLRATTRIRGENLVVDQFDRVNVSAAAAYDAASTKVLVESLNVTSPWAKLRANGDLDLRTPPRESTAQFTAREIDLGRLSATLLLPVRIASTATVEGQAHWPGLQFEAAGGTASARLQAFGGPAKDTIPVDAAIRATMRGNRLTVGIDELRAAGAAATGEVVLVDRKSLEGEVHVEVPRISSSIAAAGSLLGKELVAGLDGSLTAVAKLAGTVSAPSAGVAVAARGVSFGDLHGVAVNAAGAYTPDRISIDGASATWQAQTLHAAGTVGLGDRKPLQLIARADISLATILAGLAGNLTVTADVGGTVDSPNATIAIEGAGIEAWHEPIGTLQARAQFQGRQLEVSQMNAGPLRVSGTFDFDSNRYRFQAAAADWRLAGLTLPDGTAIRGTVNLDASGQGVGDDPAGDLKLIADGLRVGDRELGRAEVTVKAASQQAGIEAAVPKFNLSATAKTGLREPYPATAQVRLARSDLAQLPVKLDQPLEGTISAVVDAAGDLTNYEQGTARAEVSQLDVRWNGEPVRMEGPLVARYAGNTLTIEKATILAAESRVDLSGALPLEATANEGAIRLSAQLNLPGLARLAPSMKVDVEGTASVVGGVRGTLRRLDPELAVSVDNGRLGPVTNARLRGQVRDGALEIESASANWGEASFTAFGAIPLALLPADLPVDFPRRQGPAKLTADLKGVNLAAIAGMPKAVTGMVSAHVEVEAPKPELDAVKATLTFPELQARLDTYTVAQDGPSEIVLENGIAQVRRLHLTGPATEVQLSGTAEIAGKQALDLHLDGQLDASLAAAFTDALRARGATEIHAAVTGSVSQPQAKGYVQIADGQFSIADPRVGVEGLNLRVDLDGTRATVSKLEGQVNGGTLGGQGSIALVDGTLKDSDLSIRADDLYMDFPAGLKTISDVRLQLKSVENLLALRGSVLIKEGGFTDDLNFDKGILAAVTAPRGLDLTEQRNALLDSVRFNVSVVTQDPIVVQNNLAKAEITAQLVVLGSPYEPGLAGRLVIEEGSQLTLQERRYEVTRGIVTFTSERRIEPTLDIEATTTASNLDITVRISGPPAQTKTELTAYPCCVPEPDIMAILLTGKTLEEIRGQEFQVAQTQVLSYLTGRVGSSIGRQLEKATGLSRVRVEPSLIAAEVSPGARLTVGQDITRQFQLIYSMDLVNSSDQIYIAEYDLTKRFVTEGVRQSDGSFRFDFRHHVSFGGLAPPQATRRQDRRIGGLTLSGSTYFPETKVLDKLKVRPGNRYDFFKLRTGLDRVTRLYTNEGLLESSIRMRREQKESTVNLNLNIVPGPRLEFVFEGAAVPGGVEKELRRVWYSGVFDTQRAEDGAGVLRAWLIGDHYLTPEIKPQITTPAPDRKRVLFEIHRGPRFEGVEWVFEGASGLDGKRLRAAIESQKLSIEVYTKPSRVTELLTEFCHEMGYLDAAVNAPRYELNQETRTGRVVFPVNEGPLYRVGEAHFEGNKALSAEDLVEAVPLPSGGEYRPILRENAIQRLREAYWSRGYNDMETAVELQRIPERARVNMNFRITENARGVVEDVTIEGNRKTSENLIRTQLEIRPGDPVSLQKIGNSRRKLYNTGAFSVVDIAREDVQQPAANGDHRVHLRVRVREVQPFEIRYGGFYDTEHGPGGIIDISNRNTLRSARVLGFRGRYDSQLREARVYFSQPLLTRFPVKTIASPYLRHEIVPEKELVAGFNVDRLGFSLQQEAALGGKMLLNYGYRIERTHTYDTGPDPIFDVRLRIAALTSTFSRDTRDELLDASKGSFLSQAFQFSPETLGSQVRFVKYFGQYFRYFPLQRPRVELFTNRVLRPRLVYASGIRVGLATGLGGQEIPLSERFLAGGSTTLRGFEQNSVGSARSGSIPLGGNGMLVLNNELRFPLFRIFDGVGFVDVGNVYTKVADFSLTDIRKDAGFGLRVRTPWLLLRLDYGFNLDRRLGEPAGRLFFSIGQAF